MGITTVGMNQLEQMLQQNGLKFDGLKMAELGNQFLYLDPPSQYPHLYVAKGYFESKGVKHTSFDINGKDGVIPCDLSNPLEDQLSDKSILGSFDVVTDFGTGEHVPDFYGCMRNIYNLCKPGGLVLRINPLTNNWPGHGYHYMTIDITNQLAKVCGYAVQYLVTQPTLGNSVDGWQVFTNLKKLSDKPFPSLADFDVHPLKK